MLICLLCRLDAYAVENINNPSRIINLPCELQEISGIKILNKNTAICVQDEKCSVYVIDLLKGNIKKEFDYDISGDFEDIALFDQTVYLLRSDGVLFEIKDYTSEHNEIVKHELGFYAKNNESLCLDINNNRLLIVSKSKPGRGKEYKDKIFIYDFDLNIKTLDNNPATVILVDDIIKYAEEKDIGIPVKKNKKGKKKKIRFRPSGIAIHPIVKNYFIVSSLDSLIIEVTPDGQIINVSCLNKTIYKQPEGIDILSDGSIYISNEGEIESPTIVVIHSKDNAEIFQLRKGERQ